MEDEVREIANLTPLVVPEDTDLNTVRSIMRANKILQVPIVNAEGRLRGLHLWDAFDATVGHEHSMVIMVGGKGTRLRPYTENCPKPMLPIAGKPMLQHIIERAKSQGFRNFTLAINYLGEIIREYFGDGSTFGVRITYIEETEPLGTAGALSLMKAYPDKAFIVTNGDVLTDIDYHGLIHFLERHNASGVMAVRMYEWKNPYGVVRMEGLNIIGFAEKPITRTHINAGIYAFSPAALNHLSRRHYCDMPTLFNRLREAKLPTVAYPMHEPWLDVGRPDDLELANAKFSAQSEK